MAKDENEKEKPKFKIIDRRRGDDEPDTADAPMEPEVKAPPKAKAPSAEGPGPEKPTEDMGKTEMTEEEKEAIRKEVEQSFKFKNTVIFIIRTISEQIWMHLGLVPNPITNLTVKNLEEARKLIDLYETILKHTEGEFDEKTLREIQRLLGDLKVNYTNQLGG
jgi:hypothetical protein